MGAVRQPGVDTTEENGTPPVTRSSLAEIDGSGPVVVANLGPGHPFWAWEG